jgi:galactokinase
VIGRGTARAGAAGLDPSALRAALVEREPAAAQDPVSVEIVRAPGRVNLIGEHTDYNDGFVLPAAIDLEIALALVPMPDRRVEITLLADGATIGFDLDAPPGPGGGGIDYLSGMAWSLAAAGVPMRGFRAVLASNLPMSAGLSSSAALELTSAWALMEPSARPRTDADRMRLAQLAQRAENEFVGVRSGLMDQFASSLGREGAAMLLDCRSLEFRAVPLPLTDHALVVCDSGAPRELAGSAYNARRKQCERAVAIIAQEAPSVRSLRDVDEAILARTADLLDEETRRRVEHVVAENARVVRCVTAFETGDLATVGRLFAESHRSLRDLYEVSSPALDALVDIAAAVPGTAAARMTGAGFGGCTVNLVARDAIDRFRDVVASEYPARTGLQARVLVVRPAAGAGVVS